MSILAQHLKELREERNKTQKEIADFLKITVRSYQRYESNEREPKIETIKKIAIYYNVTLDYLAGLTNKK